MSKREMNTAAKRFIGKVLLDGHLSSGYSI